MNRLLSTAIVAAFSIVATTAFAQVHDHHAGDGQTLQARATVARLGPHGGALHQVNGLQLETVIEAGGVSVIAYDLTGKNIPAAEARGVVSLQVENGAKRYRYNLLPDGRGRLTAAVDLSDIAGRQIELNFHLIGVGAAASQPIVFSELATVPASPHQLAAAAIARQKLCPVSGKPLGSMGEPIAVEVGGQTVYVCCAGCVDAVKASPTKYAAGRPEVTVAAITAADAQLIAKQATCPVMDESLGSMGQPVKVMVGDKPVFLCCKGCVKKVQAEPAKYLAIVYGGTTQGQPQTPAANDGQEVRDGVFKATAAEASFVAAQKRCPVMDEPLDAMGGPYRVNAAGRAIYICCPGCAKKIAAEPQKYLAALAEQGVDAPRLR